MVVAAQSVENAGFGYLPGLGWHFFIGKPLHKSAELGNQPFLGACFHSHLPTSFPSQMG